MSNFFAEIFTYDFMLRALIVGVLVSLCAALLGVHLVLKRYSMIGDGLSHVAFGTLAVALACNLAPMAVAMPVVILAAFCLLRMSQNGKLKGDAAVALISTSSLAIGVIAVSLSSGMTTDVYSYMFGSVLAMSADDVTLSVAVSAAVLVLYGIFYHKIFAITFDETFARATGVRVGIYNTLLAVLTAVTIVIGMKIMGALLISALLVFPALTSMRLFKTFRSVVICSAVLCVACFVCGLFVSFAYSFPTGASVVLVDLIGFILFSLIAAARQKNRNLPEKPRDVFDKGKK